METPYITIWERIDFLDGEAVSWQRSWDEGKTWEDMNWPGDKPPFIVINRTPELAFVIEKRLMPHTTASDQVVEETQ